MMVPAPSFFCMTRWLPLWRTATKPWVRRRSQQDSPEKTLRLGILRLELGDPGFAAEATPDLGSGGGFEKEVDGFPQVGQGGFRGVALAGDIQIRIEGDVRFALFADDGGEAGFRSTNLNRAVTESNWVGGGWFAEDGRLVAARLRLRLRLRLRKAEKIINGAHPFWKSEV